LVVLALVAGCSGAAPHPAGAPTTARSPAPAAAPAPDLVAEARDATLDVYAAPGAGEAPTLTLRAADEAGGRLVLAAQGPPSSDGWVAVELAVRPNGSRGFVRADDVDLATTPYRIRVDLGAHRLEVRRGDELVVDTAIGIGNEAPPVPGHYFLRDLLQPAEPFGDYGPFAYTLSGYALTTTSVLGGDGRLAIHGTNAPDDLGADGGPGSIRVTNDVVTYLVRRVRPPLGTRVDVEG
jgi:lipoprotein-anchoring transpeptidase ErfK/SrfK